MLARLARLPAPGEAVDVRLLVTAREHGEDWRRMFAGYPLLTRQSTRSDGLLVERFGIVEMRFCLRVVGGALLYHSISAALCIGSWRVRLPRRLSPRIVARERAVGEPDQIYVSVEVDFAGLGLLIAYEGNLTGIEVME
jgi:hypothetical protein